LFITILSAYGCFTFESSFFERCTAPPSSTSTSRKRARRRSRGQRRDDDESDEEEEEEEDEEQCFSCRVAVRALAPVVKPRKDVVSLRITSEVSSSCLFLSFEFVTRKSNNNDNNGDGGGGGGPPNYCGDTLLTTVHRVRVADADTVTAVASRDGASEIVAPAKVMLRLLEPLKRTVEAVLTVRKDADTVVAQSFHHGAAADKNATAASSSNGGGINNNAIFQANSASLLQTETAVGTSEFSEFFFRDDRGDAAADEDEDGDDATMTTMNDGDDEDERDENRPRSTNANGGDSDGGSRRKRDAAAAASDNNMPSDVNSKVLLVFPIRECRAMLQFCCTLQQLQSSSLPMGGGGGGGGFGRYGDNVGGGNNNNDPDDVLRRQRAGGGDGSVSLFFHWGGKPLSLETATETSKAELVLATLDYNLLKAYHTE